MLLILVIILLFVFTQGECWYMVYISYLFPLSHYLQTYTNTPLVTPLQLVIMIVAVLTCISLVYIIYKMQTSTHTVEYLAIYFAKGLVKE